jgi:hypothetical protein
LADQIYDSAVFLKTGSLTVDPANTTVSLVLEGTQVQPFSW